MRPLVIAICCVVGWVGCKEQQVAANVPDLTFATAGHDLAVVVGGEDLAVAKADLLAAGGGCGKTATTGY